MGAITNNPGIASLYQALSKSSPVLASASVQTALENASPTDIADISVAATQLEGVNELFGISSGASSDPSSQLSGILSNLQTSSTPQAAGTESGSATTAALSAAQQLADWQTTTEAQSLDSLFGASSTGPNLVNMLG